jgi:Flp pilus assembly protein TadG
MVFRNANKLNRRVMRGQAMVEFALVGTILIALIFGILEMGRLVFINSELENAASEGAHYAAINCGASDANIVARAKSKLVLADRSAVSVPTPIVRPLCSYCPVQVTVRYTWNSVVSFIPGVTLVHMSTKLIEFVPGSCP